MNKQKFIVKISLLPLKGDDYVITKREKGDIIRAINLAVDKYLFGDAYGGWFQGTGDWFM